MHKTQNTTPWVSEANPTKFNKTSKKETDKIQKNLFPKFLNNSCLKNTSVQLDDQWLNARLCPFSTPLFCAVWTPILNLLSEIFSTLRLSEMLFFHKLPNIYFFKHFLQISHSLKIINGQNHMCSEIRPVTTLGHQEGRRVFWEGPKVFELCPIVLNDVQHIFPGGRKFF